MSDHVVIHCGHPELGAVEVLTSDVELTAAQLAKDAQLARKIQAERAGREARQRAGQELAAQAAAGKAQTERLAKLNELRQRAQDNPDVRLLMEVLGI